MPNNDDNFTNYEPNFTLRDALTDVTSEELSEDRENLYENIAGNYQSDFDSASWSNGELRRTRVGRNKHRRKQKPKSPPVSLTRRGLGLLLVCCMLLSCIFGLGGSFLTYSLMSNKSLESADSQVADPAEYTPETAMGGQLTVQQITTKCQNSVVEIKTESATSDSWMQQYVTEGAGSGIIISKDGYIMTNNHVIDGAGKITVTTADDKSYDAKLIGTDSTNDVAVIKIKADKLTPVTFGNSDKLSVGDMAVAIGNPLGELGGTVTAGIISATDRELAIEGKTMNLLQTDSSINPGNSGGGLFNSNGQLIGMVVAKSSGSDIEGLGFAIPVNTAVNVANQLMDTGYVKGQPWTGMTYTEGSSGFDSFFGTGSHSVYIYSVDTATAKLAGFRAGDTVLSVDGTNITSIEDFSAIITSHKVGDKLKFIISRNGEKKELTLKLQEKTKNT